MNRLKEISKQLPQKFQDILNFLSHSRYLFLKDYVYGKLENTGPETHGFLYQTYRRKMKEYYLLKTHSRD